MRIWHRPRNRGPKWLLVFLSLLPFVGNLPAGQIVAWGDYGGPVPWNAVDIRAIAAGVGFNIALKVDGTVLAWGDNSLGQIDVPPGLTNVSAIAAGAGHSLALRRYGTVIAWGYGAWGLTNIPPELTNVLGIAAGGSHSLAMLSDGSVAAWGNNDFGQTNIPPGLTHVVAIASGGAHSLALQSSGTVVAWGDNDFGQTNVPPGLTNVTAVAGGELFSLALCNNGTVVAWGNNDYGQTSVPVGLTDVAAIAAGSRHSLALRSNSTVVAWGFSDWYGQTNVPPGLTNVMAVAAGSSHSLALLSYWPPVILVQPTNQIVYTGRECTLSVVASSSEPLRYQWRFHWSDIHDIPGATNSQLTLSAVTLADAGLYQVVVSNALGLAESQSAQLTVIESGPTISQQPIDQPFHPGDNIVLQAAAFGPGPLDFQWRMNGIAIPGATNASLVVSNASFGSRGVYTVMVRNPNGFVISDPALLFVPSKHEFNNLEGPLIWDFSGTYPSPLGILQQNTNGFLVNNEGAQGRVWPVGSSVGVSLTKSRAPYWIGIGTPHIEYIFQDYCTTTLTLNPSQRFLSGKTSCITVGQEYEFFMFTFVPYRHLTTTRSSASLDQPLPLPDGVDGHWQLALNAVPNGNRLVGKAFITLSSGTVISLEVTGTNSLINKSVMKLQSSLNSLDVVTAGPEMALQSIHGVVVGQTINYNAPIRTSPLSVNINGGGNVIPLKNGQALVIGRNYTLNAVPRPGNLLSNWIVADTLVNSPALLFTMSSNLTITANFVTNPFLTAKGIYNGLVIDTSNVTFTNAGLINLTVNDKGVFSGKLLLAGANLPLAGSFGVDGKATVKINRTGKPALTNQLVLDLVSKEALGGSVSDGAFTVPIQAAKSVFALTNPAPYAGKYTLIIPGTNEVTGDGIGTVSVNGAGTITLAGALADGTVVNQSVPVSREGWWPIYLPLYMGKGMFISWAQFDTNGTIDLHGDAVWTKNPAPGKYYTNGFTLLTRIEGGEYEPPAVGPTNLVLALTNGTVTLTDGNLLTAITNSVVLTNNNVVRITGTNGLKLTITPSSGLVNGSFIHPVTKLVTPIKAVVQQGRTNIDGYFLGPNASGAVLLQP